VQKDKEVELDAMRKENSPRMTERARREEEYTASLHETRQRVDSLETQILEVGRERDEYKEKSIDDEKKNKDLKSKVQHLKTMEEKMATYRGKCMQLGQEKKTLQAALDNAHRYIQQLKAALMKKETCVVIGNMEEEEATIPSRSTIYRRADHLANSILDVAIKSIKTFDRVWEVVMRKESVKHVFSKADVTLCYKEDDDLNSMVGGSHPRRRAVGKSQS